MTLAVSAILLYLAIIVFFIGGWIGQIVHTLRVPEATLVDIAGCFIPFLGAVKFWFF